MAKETILVDAKKYNELLNLVKERTQSNSRINGRFVLNQLLDMVVKEDESKERYYLISFTAVVNNKQVNGSFYRIQIGFLTITQLIKFVEEGYCAKNVIILGVHEFGSQEEFEEFKK